MNPPPGGSLDCCSSAEFCHTTLCGAWPTPQLCAVKCPVVLRGGPTLNQYLKKRMFLTLFGVITKKGYLIFDGATDTKIRSAISKEFHDNGKDLLAEFATIPHLYLS